LARFEDVGRNESLLQKREKRGENINLIGGVSVKKEERSRKRKKRVKWDEIDDLGRGGGGRGSYY